MPQETTENPQIIRPGSPEDPYFQTVRNLTCALDVFVAVLEVKSAEYWATIAQWVEDHHSGDPGMRHQILTDPAVVLQEHQTAMAEATVIYRRECHEAAMILVARMQFIIADPAIKGPLQIPQTARGKPCPNKSD